MRPFSALLALCALGALSACRSDQGFVSAELELEVLSPAYGEFLGEGSAMVTGRVNHPGATVTVEGVEVQTGEEGVFAVEVAPEGPYRNIDVVASLGGQSLRERIPVFRGNDPLSSWPGGVSVRVLQPGLDAMGTRMGATIDALGWAEQIGAALPAVDLGWLVMSPVGVEADPTTVELSGAEGGLETAIALNGLRVLYDLDFDVFGLSWSAEMGLGYDTVAIGALAVPMVDEEGIVSLSLQDPTVDLDDVQVELDGVDALLLEWVLDAVGQYVTEPLAELLAGFVTDSLGSLSLGGPFEFETSLLDTSVAVALDEVYGEVDGLGVGLGMALGADASLSDLPALDLAAPTDAQVGDLQAQVALALHEGLFQTLLSSTLLDLLTQEMDLSGTYGDLLAGGITSLPGGDEAPEGDGWCIALDPGTARVARLQEGIAPLAVFYLPDLRFDVGVLDGSRCEDWLSASLAVEVGLVVEDGTKLGVDIAVAEGAVLYYGAEEGWDEAEVVEGLASYLQTILALVGGALSFDLGDLMGGLGDLGGGEGDVLTPLLSDLSPEITGSDALHDEAGAPVEGLYAVSLTLWAE
jgi:hypothetical protein